jgi:hypothetical protein
MKSLYHFLSKCPDHRRAQGKRVPLAAFLEMIVLAGMSGQFGQRPVQRFVKNNASFFENRYSLIHGAPSGTSIQNFLRALNFSHLNEALFNWAKQYLNKEAWLSVDGKALGSTLVDRNGKKQNFKTLVTIFCQENEIVVKSKSMENKKSHEIYCAKTLIEELNLKGMTFTMDALHCKKKPRKLSWSQEMSTYYK